MDALQSFNLSDSWPWILLGLGIGYLFGTFPTGLLLTRWAGLGDIRKIGSGNIGATNALRTGNKWVAVGTLLGDALKAVLAILLVAWLGKGLPVAPLAAGLGALLGHIYPVWLGFRGGKGISTQIGILLAVFWPVGLLFCATWLLVAVLFRYSSLSALVATALTPIYLYFFDMPFVLVLSLAIGVLVFYAHRENISRLASGTESKIGSKSAASEG